MPLAMTPSPCCRSGCPLRDWDLLQRLSCSNPEAFWPPVLAQLGIRFHTPPHRCALHTHLPRHPWVLVRSCVPPLHCFGLDEQ